MFSLIFCYQELNHVIENSVTIESATSAPQTIPTKPAEYDDEPKADEYDKDAFVESINASSKHEHWRQRHKRIPWFQLR